MRAAIRARANRFFVDHPKFGRLGYDLLRVSGLDRSTRGVKDYYKKFIRLGFHPQIVADIGANYGGWSREVRGVYKDALFFLIEPQEEMGPFLDQFVATAPGSRWFLGGAGAAQGELTLTLWDDLQGSAFLSEDIHKLTPYRRQRNVPIFTLDSLIHQGKMPVPDLVKIDVQGYELEVLRGSIGCLGKTDVFIVESSFLHPLGLRPTYYRVVEFMEAYGYRIFDLLDLKYGPGDGVLWQADICFVHENSQLASHVQGTKVQRDTVP